MRFVEVGGLLRGASTSVMFPPILDKSDVFIVKTEVLSD